MIRFENLRQPEHLSHNVGSFKSAPFFFIYSAKDKKEMKKFGHKIQFIR